jgi:hypothetical protein
LKLPEKLLIVSVAIALCGIAGYAWLVGSVGGQTAIGNRVYPAGVLLTAAVGVVALFAATYAQRRLAYVALAISGVFVVAVFTFVAAVEPRVAYEAGQSRIAAFQTRAARNAIESLQCDDGAAVHMLESSERRWSVMLFRREGESRRAEQLAGFNVLDLARRCELSDPVGLRESRAELLASCTNVSGRSVEHLVERIRNKSCPYEEKAR